MECHQEQRSECLSKSPRANNVNTQLAKINRPAGRLDNVLQALGPSKDPANKVNHCAPKNNKNKHATSLESLTGVDQEVPKALATNQETKVGDSPQARVRISDVTETVYANPSPATIPTTRRYILQPLLIGTSQSSTTSLSDEDASNNKTHVKEVQDCSNMLFKEYSKDGMKATSYHITDFAGL